MTRRRYLGGDELVDMLARRVRRVTGKPDCTDIVCATIHELAAVGVDVNGLVKAEVDEADVVNYPGGSALDALFMSWLKSSVRKRGGEPCGARTVTAPNSARI